MQDPDFSRKAARVLHSELFVCPPAPQTMPVAEFLASRQAMQDRRDAFQAACEAARTADDLAPEMRALYEQGLKLLGG